MEQRVLHQCIQESPEGLQLNIVVQSPLGLHARSAARLVMEMQNCHAEIRIQHQGNIVDAKSILDILSLAATQGSQLHIWATGKDAHQALLRITELFASDFRATAP